MALDNVYFNPKQLDACASAVIKFNHFVKDYTMQQMKDKLLDAAERAVADMHSLNRDHSYIGTLGYRVVSFRYPEGVELAVTTEDGIHYKTVYDAVEFFLDPAILFIYGV